MSESEDATSLALRTYIISSCRARTWENAGSVSPPSPPDCCVAPVFAAHQKIPRGGCPPPAAFPFAVLSPSTLALLVLSKRSESKGVQPRLALSEAQWNRTGISPCRMTSAESYPFRGEFPELVTSCRLRRWRFRLSSSRTGCKPAGRFLRRSLQTGNTTGLKALHHLPRKAEGWTTRALTSSCAYRRALAVRLRQSLFENSDRNTQLDSP